MSPFIQLAEASLENANLMLLQPWLLSVEVPKWMKEKLARTDEAGCTYAVPVSISVSAIKLCSEMQKSRSKRQKDAACGESA